MFLDHTQRRRTVGRAPLDEWSARRRDLYLTTHDTHNRQISMPQVGFEPKISAGERPAAAHLLRSWKEKERIRKERRGEERRKKERRKKGERKKKERTEKERKEKEGNKKERNPDVSKNWSIRIKFNWGMEVLSVCPSVWVWNLVSRMMGNIYAKYLWKMITVVQNVTLCKC